MGGPAIHGALQSEAGCGQFGSSVDKSEGKTNRALTKLVSGKEGRCTFGVASGKWKDKEIDR